MSPARGALLEALQSLSAAFDALDRAAGALGGIEAAAALEALAAGVLARWVLRGDDAEETLMDNISQCAREEVDRARARRGWL